MKEEVKEWIRGVVIPARPGFNLEKPPCVLKRIYQHSRDIVYLYSMSCSFPILENFFTPFKCRINELEILHELPLAL